MNMSGDLAVQEMFVLLVRSLACLMDGQSSIHCPLLNTIMLDVLLRLSAQSNQALLMCLTAGSWSDEHTSDVISMVLAA
jgi:hypothetical protein